MHPSSLAARTLAASLLSPALAAAAAAPLPAPTPVVVVVRVAKPWYAPRAAVIGKMRDTIAQYEQLPGLAFKVFSLERESSEYGGLYYWRDAAAASAWFNEGWFERTLRRRSTSPAGG
jgi:hypothetical protein